MGGWRAKAVDANQKAIVADLRKAGLAVILLHTVGQGVPDLLVSSQTKMRLWEIKVPKEKLNERQVEWHTDWRGVPPGVASDSSTILADFGML